METVPHVPVVAFLLVLALFVAFVVFLGVLGSVAGKSLCTGPDGARGTFGGIATAFVAAFLCLLGVAGFAGLLAGVGATAAGAMLDAPLRNIERIEVERTGREPPVELRVEWRGEPSEEVAELLREFTRAEPRVERLIDERGRAITAYEVALPIEEYELKALQDELRRELDGYELPEGVRIHVRER